MFRKATSVLIREKITYEAISSLLQKQSVVVVVPNYFPKDQCQQLTEKIMEISSEPYYHEEKAADNKKNFIYYGVDRIGVPFNSCYGTPADSEQRKTYFEQSEKFRKLLRSAAAPNQYPLDKLRLDLDEAWPQGAKLATFGTLKSNTIKKMFAGIVRIMKPSTSYLSEDVPHFDKLPKDEFSFDAQLAANVFLSVPSEKGELEVWHTEKECDEHTDLNTITRQALGEGILVKPNVGDLIIMNPRVPHAIRGFNEQTVRISVNSFIGVDNNGLHLWN